MNATAFIVTHESNPERKEKSFSFIALELARSLGRSGVKVVRVHPNKLDHSLSSRYWSGLELCPNFYDSETALLEFLLELPNRYAGQRVLIPASDDCAYFLAKHHAALNSGFRVLGPSWNAMQPILDKRGQYEVAQRLSITIPETYFPANADEVAALAERIDNYPYVIKPLLAHTWRLASMRQVSKGKKAFLISDAKELKHVYASVGHSDAPVMIQEVIGGQDERLLTFLGYFSENSEPLAYCVRKKVRQCPIDFGYCTLTESCHDDVVTEQSVRLLQSVRYHGIVGVEWKLDPKTNTHKLIEINPRAVNTIALARACGVDIPATAFMDKIGAPVTSIHTWRDGVKWRWGVGDIWAARELHRKGRLTLHDWWRTSSGVDVHAAFAADDPQPFLASMTGELSRAVGVRVRHLASTLGRVTSTVAR